MSIGHRLAAYRELLSHYRKVFAHFWGQRDKLRGGMFNEHEAEFLPAALSLQEKPLSSTARWTARTLIALIVVAVLWASLGHVDIIVNATGRIIPSGRIKTIASVDTASVRALHVVDGQQVKAGALLIELDTSASDSEHDKATGDQGAAVLQAARAQALIAAIDGRGAARLPPLERLEEEAKIDIPEPKWQAEQLHLEGLYRDYQAKLKRAEGDIVRYSQALPLVTQRAKDYQELLKDHDVPRHAWLEKEQARVDLEGQLAAARNQRQALIEETRRSAYDQLTEGNRLAAAAQQDARRSASHSRLLKLTAPEDGTVQQLTVHTIGGVVQAAQPLMQIVPTAKAVEVDAMLDNKDVGFVREGQAAEVKIDTFQYSKYGTVPAIVTQVSRDAIPDEKKGLLYSVTVTLRKSDIMVDGTPLPLTPGMSVSVEIKTGERRIIEYVLAPFIQHQREALHER